MVRSRIVTTDEQEGGAPISVSIIGSCGPTIMKANDFIRKNVDGIKTKELHIFKKKLKQVKTLSVDC